MCPSGSLGRAGSSAGGREGKREGEAQGSHYSLSSPSLKSRARTAVFLPEQREQAEQRLERCPPACVQSAFVNIIIHSLF